MEVYEVVTSFVWTKFIRIHLWQYINKDTMDDDTVWKCPLS